MKKLHNTLTAGAAALAASMLMPATANAQITGNVEVIASENRDSTCVRPNVWFKLPGGIKGYTWADVYVKDGFYAETNLDKPVVKGLMVSSQIEHIDQLVTQAGIGIGYAFPLPENAYADVKFLPFWTDKSGRVDKKSEIDYAAGITLPHGFEISTFGVLNPKTREWVYGEITATKDLGKRVAAGYSLSLKNRGENEDGGLKPKGEHMGIVRIKL